MLDASLAFVMMGATGAHWGSYRIIDKREFPLGLAISSPTIQHIDKPLILGSSRFWLGWGLAGYCPGPGLNSGMTSGLDV